MTNRSYGQYCALAKTLDLVGERWTLLVVRELCFGPKRYTDLFDSLPGIGTSLLAKRLQHLEANGLVHKRELAPPAASVVYELTDAGQELARAMGPLTRWGATNLLGARGTDESFRAEWPIGIVASFIDRARIGTVDDEYEFRIDESTAHISVHRGDVTVRPGAARRAAVTFTTDVQTFVELGAGRLIPEEAVAQGRLAIDGEPAAVQRFTELVFEPALGR